MDPKYKILHSPPPQDFPRNKIPSSGLLPPIEDLQYTDLIRAADETHQQVFCGNWNPKNALAYLSYFCLKTDLAEKIVEHSMNMKLYEYLCMIETEKISLSIEKGFLLLLHKGQYWVLIFQDVSVEDNFADIMD